MRLALLTVVFLVVSAAPASAEVLVKLGIQGYGSVVNDGGEPLPCTPGRDDSQVVPCPDFPAPGTTYRMRAVAPDAPTGHWTFDRWDGDCLPPLPGDPEEVCVVGDGATDSQAQVTAVFDDVKGPTVETVTEIRPGPQGAVGFQFTADEDATHGATFECWVDAGTPADCSDGGIDYTDVPPGAHTFYVRGTDASGQPSEKDGEAPFTIDPPAAIAPAPVTPKPAPFVPPIPRVLGPSSVTAKVSRKRAFSLGQVRLVCPAVAVPCNARATLRGRLRKGGTQVRLAGRPLVLRPSSSSAVKLELGRRAAAALRNRGRLRATASLEVRAPDATTRKDVSVTLRPAKRR